MRVRLAVTRRSRAGVAMVPMRVPTMRAAPRVVKFAMSPKTTVARTAPPTWKTKVPKPMTIDSSSHWSGRLRPRMPSASRSGTGSGRCWTRSLVAKKARVKSAMPTKATMAAEVVQPTALVSAGPKRTVSARAIVAPIRAQDTVFARSSSSEVMTAVSDQ